MQKILCLSFMIVFSLFVWAEELQVTPPICFDVKVMPTNQEAIDISGMYHSYIARGSDSIPMEMMLENNIVMENNISLYNDNDFVSDDTVDANPHHLGNSRFIEAIIANGQTITGYMLLLDENGPFKTVTIDIIGFDHEKQLFHVRFVNGENGTIDYKYMCQNLVYAECGQEKSKTWSIEFIREKQNEEMNEKMYSRSEAVTIEAINLEQAIKNAYRELSEKHPILHDSSEKLSCLVHIAPSKELMASRPEFVNINYELYMYKFKGGVYGKGQVIVYPQNLKTKYNYLQFITLNVDRGRCSNYIGGQTDQCEGWGSFYVDHVIIANRFDNGNIFFQIVGFRNCNVAKYSFENYKVPAIVRGTSQWIY